MMSHISKQNRQDMLFNAGLYSLYLCCFFLSISTSLMNLTTMAAMIFYILSGEVKNLPSTLRSNPICWPSLLLFTMLVIGLFYTEAKTAEDYLIFKKYRELIYFPIIFSYLSSAVQRYRNVFPIRIAKGSFLIGATISMCISYAMYFGWLPSEKYGYSTIHHIAHSFFMSLLGFWALQYAIRPLAGKTLTITRILCTLLFILACTNLFVVAPGRTGMAVLIFLVIVTIFQRMKPLQAFIAIILAISVVFGIYKGSHNFSYQVNKAIKDIRTYKPGASRSSLGMRFDWWHNSLTLIQEKPIFGHGTGSFRAAQEQLVKGTRTRLSDNPHNEFLMIGVQFGMVGEALFLLFLGTLFAYSYKLPQENRNLLQGSILAFIWGCTVNSFLFDTHPSHYFLIISAILCSSRVNRKGQDLIPLPGNHCENQKALE